MKKESDKDQVRKPYVSPCLRCNEEKLERKEVEEKLKKILNRNFNNKSSGQGLSR